MDVVLPQPETVWNNQSFSSLIGLVFVLLSSYVLRRYSKLKNLPPGPRYNVLGLTGALSSLPPWERFHTLHKLFGPVMSFYQGRTPVLVLGSIKAATDLLEKRGGIYSSRPRSIMAGEILADGMRAVPMPYGPRWRKWRTIMHASIGTEASRNFKPLQSLESKILLRELLVAADPSAYPPLLRKYAASVAVTTAYGRRVDSLNDPLITINHETDEAFARFGAFTDTGKYIVESWPFLLYLPKALQWFRYAPERQRKIDVQNYVTFINEVRDKVARGSAQFSAALKAIEKQEELGFTDAQISYAAAAPFNAGVGTSLASMEIFLMAMLHHPEAMKKAQEEIDRVVGPTVLPEFDDVPRLPYVMALIHETMRWRPIIPLGIAHSVISDDTYDDYHIPNASTVFANLYSMSKDEQMFPSPDKFEPERYLHPDPTLPKPNSSFFFGFGRRICPGMHVAQNTLFIAITRLLWAYDIIPPKDAAGKPILPDTNDFDEGLVIHPRPFKYHFVLRRESARALIEEEYSQALVDAVAWM
ncbi:cytochrome P450 [Panaeolus papilionaceus]|nr:cytochrome P450 [Panaeolus papilionaceus]